MRATGQQRGASLLEVLVALFVVSLGLLGIASLFARGQLMADESLQRFQALSIAHEMVERLSSNRQQAADLSGSDYVTATPASTTLGSTAPSGFVNCATSTCTSAQVAIYDLTNFHNALTGAQKQSGGNSVNSLSVPRGCVEFLGTAGSNNDPPRFRISVTWQGRQAAATLPNTVSTCASSIYNNEALRRIVSLEVQVL